VCAAIIAAAAVACGRKAYTDLTTTANILAPQSVADSNLTNGAWQCIYRSIRADVPEGAPVYIDIRTSDLYFLQRLTEMTTPWAVPVPRMSAARLVLSVSRGAGHGNCSGLELAVRHR
jgi:hypothetical protein